MDSMFFGSTVLMPLAPSRFCSKVGAVSSTTWMKNCKIVWDVAF